MGIRTEDAVEESTHQLENTLPQTKPNTEERETVNVCNKDFFRHKKMNEFITNGTEISREGLQGKNKMTRW